MSASGDLLPNRKASSVSSNVLAVPLGSPETTVPLPLV